MELVLKMNPEEAITVAENGTLKALVESFKESYQPVTKVVEPQTEPIAAFTVPTWTPGGGAVDDSLPQETEPIVPQQTVPTEARSYTADELQKAAIALMDKGVSMDDIAAVLGKHGVSSLPELTPDKFGAFALDLRQLGADI
ncbi:MAG: hypothetical protein HXL86_00060 [[Eubacterium] sulci]|nr:hypothetical protein [[Eubacterium] sulci]